MVNGQFIGVEGINTFEIRKTFNVRGVCCATLSCACLGLFFATINGRRVGKSYLMPGWTSYNNSLQVARFDIEQYLKDGENEIVFTVSEGWYKGPLSWERVSSYYGDTNAICAQLDLDEVQIVTDLTWLATTSHIVKSGIYDGEKVDLITPRETLNIVEVKYDKSKLVEQICPFVEITEELLPIKVTKTSGGYLYDFGQNFAGVVKITLSNSFSGTVIMRHGELLQDGLLYTENLGSAKATDEFTCSGGGTFVPEFTYHGFRYMELQGAEPNQIEVVGQVRHTPLRKIGNIVTSNERLNRLLQNVDWSLKSNFVDIPTDCPQRAERLGWTGDINAFCTTAAFCYDIKDLMRKWLKDVVAEQAPNGEIPLVVPDMLGNIRSSAFWCDVITMVPYALYQSYGDISFIQDCYPAMQKFVSCRIRRASGGLITDGYELGDWLALDGNLLKQGNAEGGTDVYFIVNAFQVLSLGIITECAKLLGKDNDADMYLRERTRMLNAMRREYFTLSGRFAFNTMTAQALALCLGIVPNKLRTRLASELNDNITSYNYRVATGFIGTPYLLFALSDNGYHDSACKVLLNNGYPGWLYEIDVGATTIWERWNTLNSEGKPNSDGMNSCNHYAFGAVVEFVFKRIVGIEPSKNGYETFIFAPKPCKGIAEITAQHETPNGLIKAGYSQCSGKIKYFVTVPKGCKAKIVLPSGLRKTICKDFLFSEGCEDLDCQSFSAQSSFIEIFSNPKSAQAFKTAFSGLHPLVYKWLESSGQKLEFFADWLEKNNGVTPEEFDAKLEEFNKLFLQM